MAGQETQQKFNEGCKKGNHYLKDIISVAHSGGLSSTEVRWCEICGSVAVDVDFDGRTNPGQIMPMRRPKILEKAL